MLASANEFNAQYREVTASPQLLTDPKLFIKYFNYKIDIDSILGLLRLPEINTQDYDLFVTNLLDFISGVIGAITEILTEAFKDKNENDLYFLKVALSRLIVLQSTVYSKELTHPAYKPFEFHVSLNNTADRLAAVDNELLERKALQPEIYDEYLSYIKNPNTILASELKQKVINAYGTSSLMTHFFSALIEVDNPPALRQSMIDFFNHYMTIDKGVFNLDKKYDDEFIYLVDRFVNVAIKNADDLLKDPQLQFAMKNIKTVLLVVSNRSDSKTFNVATILHYQLHYPYALLDGEGGYKYNKLFDEYFNLKQLKELHGSAKKKSKTDYALYLYEFYKLNSIYFDCHAKGLPLDQANNYQYLRTRLNQLNIAELERFFRINQFSVEGYQAFSILPGRAMAINFFGEVIKSMRQYFSFLIQELKDCVNEDYNEWNEKYANVLGLVKSFYNWSVVSYVFNDELIGLELKMIENAIDDINKKNAEKLSPEKNIVKKKKKSKVKIKYEELQQPPSAVLPSVSVKPRKPIPKKTPMQRLIAAEMKNIAIEEPKIQDDADLSVLGLTLEELQANEELERTRPSVEKKKLSLPKAVEWVLGQLGERVLLVGGALRQGGTPNDYDMVFMPFNFGDDQLSQVKLRSIDLNKMVIAESLGHKGKWVGNNYPVYDLIIDDVSIQITLIEGSLQQNAYARDYSCNTLYYSVFLNVYFNFFDAEAHIKNKMIVSNKNLTESLTEDPSRILRALRLMADGYKFNPEDEKTFIENISKLKKINKNKMNFEVTKCLQVKNQVDMKRIFAKYKILETLFSYTDAQAKAYLSSLISSNYNHIWALLVMAGSNACHNRYQWISKMNSFGVYKDHHEDVLNVICQLNPKAIVSSNFSMFKDQSRIAYPRGAYASYRK